MYKKLLALLTLLYSPYCLAKYYEVGDYLISTKYKCKENNIACDHIVITVLNQFNCHSEQSIGNTIKNPSSFKINGYTFKIDTVNYMLYTKNDITLVLYTNQGIHLSSLKDGAILSEQQFQNRRQLCR